MIQLYDYFYRFPSGHVHMPGRCRVRIYKRKNGTHVVVLTELATNSGESIASACERIVTDLVVVRTLNPKTTRWIQHEPSQPGQPQVFDELQFTWDARNCAGDPRWTRIADEQVVALTGDSLDDLDRQLGDLDYQAAEGVDDESTSIS
ncbi:MAG: hypothetical protein KDD78_18565 [Caldilineaceae bacterium]|nr:hypothetical protein [Caldilineaceae bacterium]